MMPLSSVAATEASEASVKLKILSQNVLWSNCDQDPLHKQCPQARRGDIERYVVEICWRFQVLDGAANVMLIFVMSPNEDQLCLLSFGGSRHRIAQECSFL